MYLVLYEDTFQQSEVFGGTSESLCGPLRKRVTIMSPQQQLVKDRKLLTFKYKRRAHEKARQFRRSSLSPLLSCTCSSFSTDCRLCRQFIIYLQRCLFASRCLSASQLLSWILLICRIYRKTCEWYHANVICPLPEYIQLIN